jgi:hypothetical protein
MFRCKYTQYTYIVGKYQINLYQLYKPVEKSLWWAFLSCFLASANEFYISL